MRQRRKSNWIELNAVANAIGWCSVQALWVAIVIVCFANVAQADIVWTSQDVIAGPQTQTATANDGSMIDATFSFTGAPDAAEGVLDTIGAGVLNGITTDAGFTADATFIGYTISGLNFDGPSFASYFSDIVLRVDFDGTVDANLGVFNNFSPTTLRFESDGVWTTNATWTQTGNVIETTAGFAYASGDSGQPQIPNLIGATYIEFSYPSNDSNFDSIAERGYSIDLLTATPVAVPEPSPIPFLIGAALIYWGRRKRG